MTSAPISRRTLLTQGSVALGTLSMLRLAGPAHAFPRTQDTVVIPWLDQPEPNPVPEVIVRQLDWEDLDSWITPNDQFFVIKHFDLPELKAADYRLEIGGLVGQPMTLTLDDLKARERQEVTFTIECSGNSAFPFNKGLVGNAIWGGTPLAALLDEAGVADDVRRRHAELFLSFAEEAAPELKSSEQAVWMDRLETEHDNLRQALTTFHEEDSENEMRLAAALWRFWWQRGFLSEGRQRLEQALERESAAEKAIRATARDGAGALAEAQGDLAAAAVHHEAALRLRREIGDRGGEARSLIDFGIIADRMGDAERAMQLFEEALALARAEGDQPQIASGLANLGFVSLDQGDYARAEATLRESLELYRELGDRRNLCYVLGGLGTVAFATGDFVTAASLQEAALNVLRQLGDRQGMAETLADLAHAVQRHGDLARGEALFLEALSLYRDLGDPSGAAFVLTHLGRLYHQRGEETQAGTLLREGYQIAWQLGETPMQAEALEGMAEVACESGDPALCARLLGAAEALRAETRVALPAVHGPALAHCEATARAALGDAGFIAAHAEGRALSPDQAMAALTD